MIINWNEWSDGNLSMHENVKGMAKETIRGWVKSSKEGWEYSSIDGRSSGIKKTRQQAIEQLMSDLDAQEIDPYA